MKAYTEYILHTYCLFSEYILYIDTLTEGDATYTLINSSKTTTIAALVLVCFLSDRMQKEEELYKV